MQPHARRLVVGIAADEMVLEAAVNGQAQAVVTFNVRDFGTAAGQFGVDLLLPREALALLKG